MGVLTINVVGVNVYVPHTTGGSLLIAMPNASRLGISPTEALDGTPLARHLPSIWEEAVDANGNESLLVPKIFPGARLLFQLGGTPSALDLSAIMPIAQHGWLDVAPNVLSATPDSRVSGQILVTHGTVGIFQPQGGACAPRWSHEGFSKPLEQVVPGLTIRIQGVNSVTATASTWVGAGQQQVYTRTLGSTERVELYAGNLCAEDSLDWPRGSVANRANDNDFKWIYGLSGSADLPAWINMGLPYPVVRGSAMHHFLTPIEAFRAFWGGGGGAGCECNGCIDRPTQF